MFTFLAAPSADPMETTTMIIMILAMVLMVYFMMIRPENKRKKEAQATRESVKNGHKITTIGGIVGTVVDVKEDSIVIETSADRVRVEFKKWAISTNDTADEEAKAAAKKQAEEKAKAKAKKKADLE